MLGAVEDGQSVQVGQFVLEWLHTPGLREGGREETEEERIIREAEEEAEYLATLSNFHWFVYPFFKMLEMACDKIFGCKKNLDEQNRIRKE